GLVFIIWFSVALGFFAAGKPLLGGMVGYEMNDFLQDYGGKIGVFLLLLFGLIVILVRLFQFSPDKAVAYINDKGKSLATECKKDRTVKTDTDSDLENDISFTPKKEETPVVIDTDTHKKDIPVLAKEDDEGEFEVKVGAEEDT